MESIDIVLIVLLLIGGYRGYKKGFLLEIIGVLALILAVVGSFLLLDWGVQWLQPVLPDMGSALPVVVLILLFIAVVLIVSITGRILKKIIDLTLLGSIDNLVGAIVGAFKWAFIISLFLWIAENIGLDYFNEHGNEAVVYPFIKGIAPMVGAFISSIFPSLVNIYDGIIIYLNS